jgi:hypothetical protein
LEAGRALREVTGVPVSRILDSNIEVPSDRRLARRRVLCLLVDNDLDAEILVLCPKLEDLARKVDRHGFKFSHP